MLYPIIFFVLLIFATSYAIFLPRSYSAPLNTSIYLGRYHEGLSPNVITPLPYRRVQKQAPIRDEFVAEVDRSIEEDIDQRSGDGEAPPPDVSRMPSFYRRRGGGYGSNRGRACPGPGCSLIRPPSPYGYGSNYMLPTSAPDRLDLPYLPAGPPIAPMPYRSMYRRPRRPYFGSGNEGYNSMPPPYMIPGSAPGGPGQSYGPYDVNNRVFGPGPYNGYGRLPYGNTVKTPMDWQDNEMTPNLTNRPMGVPVSGPDPEVNSGPIEEANPNGSSRPPEGEVGVYMSSYGYSYAGYIERQAKMYPIMMYTLVQCIPCQRAKHLLAISYADIRSHFLELVGNEDWQRQLQVDLQHITGAVTFPYIFICGTLIRSLSTPSNWST
uniref:Glutaredoxin domain-containing protein n=1 Tax=Acrobeloides nanus TaxID=290746 RepID=A0A914E8J5_9BILA